MSCFLEILRCILCLDDQEEETRSRNNKSNYIPYYEIPYRSYAPTTTTTNATTCRMKPEPSGAYATTQIPTPSYSNSWNSTPTKTKLPETPNISFVKPKAIIHSSVVTGPKVSIKAPDKSHEAAAQKPKILAPSPFPADFSHKKAINPATDKTSAQNLPCGLLSFSSARTPDKSHEAATQKPKVLAPLPLVTGFSQKNAISPATDETSAQKSPYGLSSFSSQPSPSLTKSLSSKTLPSVSTPPPPPVSSLSSSSFGKPLASLIPCQSSTEPFLSLAPSSPTKPNSKASYIWVEKNASPIQKKAINPATDETSAQNLPYGSSSFSSQSSPSVSTPPPPPLSSLSSSSFGKPLASPNPRQSSTEPFLSLAPSSPTKPNSKTSYIWVEKDAYPIQKKAINPATDETSAQNSPYGSSSFSSQSSPSVSTPPPPPLSSLSSSSFGKPPASPNPRQSSTEPFLSLAPSSPTKPNSKTSYIWVEKDASPIQKKAINHATNETSAQNSPHGSSSFSSQSSPSVSTPPPPPLSSLSSSSFGKPPASPNPRPPSTKPFLSLAPSNPTNSRSKTAYIWVEKEASPVYAIPEDFKNSIKNDIVPGILKRPLSPSTYKDYFEALLYAEDFYLEKWDGYVMEDLVLELHEASIYKRNGKYNKKNVDDEKDDKVFVAFELDSIPERRPFLLSRDFVSVWPSGTSAEPFQGLIYRVVKSNRVLVDFGKDFHVQHYTACKYNVKFSFNRVCLKRAHQAIATALDPSFRAFLFPDSMSKNSLLTAQLPSTISKLDWHQISSVHHILSHRSAVPYLVEGPITIDRSNCLSRTGFFVCEAVLLVYRTSPSCRILICAPTNKRCDLITRNLRGKIPESNIFRANAAFREFDGVPEDILPSCHYKKERECFSCPPIHELKKFKVVSSTFMSSFRLHNEGIIAGHFSHIFLVDASSVIEPEAMVPLANLANESTVVTITGEAGNHSGWIRSKIGRENGLLISYFERLRQSELYGSLDSDVITVL